MRCVQLRHYWQRAILLLKNSKDVNSQEFIKFLQKLCRYELNTTLWIRQNYSSSYDILVLTASVAEDFVILGYDAAWLRIWNPTFRSSTLPKRTFKKRTWRSLKISIRDYTEKESNMREVGNSSFSYSQKGGKNSVELDGIHFRFTSKWVI
jgi:hypothetical protein